MGANGIRPRRSLGKSPLLLQSAFLATVPCEDTEIIAVAGDSCDGVAGVHL